MPVNSFDDYPMNWRPTLTDRRPPIYRRLAKQLAADIRAGRLKPGDKLPPQRELADFLDVHLSTITRTYKLCEEQGLICAKVGQGTFVASDVATTDTLLYSQTPRDLIQMGTVLPPYEGNMQLMDFIRQCLQQPDIHRFLQYHAPLGTATQRRTFAQWLTHVGVTASTDALLFATGAQNALCAAFLGCFKAGDRVGAMALTFPGLKGIAKMVGVQLVPLPEKNGHLQLDALAAFCQREHLRALYLISDQHNPTTVSLSDQERRFLATLAQTHNLFLIEDAINRPFCEKAPPPLYAYAPAHTLFILSVSKFLGAGLRVAVVVAPPDYRSAMETALYNMNLMVSPFNLELTSRLLLSPLWPTLLAEKRRQLHRRYAIACDALAGYEVQGAPNCCFCWLSLPAPWTGQRFEDAAAQAGVQVFCAERFTTSNTPPPAAVRLCISAPETSDALRQGLHQLRTLLES